jgi:predicted  nucleic acid-binding Zn-ribbon protein
MSRIASLIEKAINRELIARTIEGDTDDALSLSANARAGFLELARHEMSGRVDAEAESSAFADLDRLRAELDARRSELEEKERRLESLGPGLEDDSLERRLRAVFASRAAGRDPDLEGEVVRVALEELAEMRCRAQEKRRAESRRETHQLERRIAKLAGLLEQTEGELRRTKAERAVDPGLASVFAEVQGLDQGDERFAQKQDLMKCIFEANLELQS